MTDQARGARQPDNDNQPMATGNTGSNLGWLDLRAEGIVSGGVP
jgi:hypothetical protein